MSISIFTAPSTIQSAYSPIVFEVTSSSTNVETKILAEIYYRRKPKDFWRKCGKKIQSKFINMDYFKFNIANVLQKVLTFDYINGSSTGIYTPNQQSAIEYYVKFTEYWPDGDGVYTSHDTTSSSSYWACNTTKLKTESQSLTDYIIAAASQNKFLTNSPSVIPIRVGEKAELSFLTTETSVVGKIKETKQNGTNSTATVNLSAQELFQYMWDFEIDADNTVTIPTEGNNIDTVDGTYNALADASKTVWGGIKLNAAIGSSLYIDIPAGFTKVSIQVKALTTDADFTPHYYWGGSWGSTTGFTAVAGVPYTYTYTFPSGATQFRLEKTSGANQVEIYWGKFIYSTSQIISKRGILNIDNTEVASDTYKLEAWLEDGSNNRISEIKTFLADHVARSETVRIEWFNHRGGFDQYTFTAGQSEKNEVEKVKFLRELQTTFTTADRGLGVAFVESVIKFSSFSQFENTDTLRWLAEIIDSPEVYLIVNDTRIAIDILSKDATPKIQNNLSQMELQWQFASIRNIQNG